MANPVKKVKKCTPSKSSTSREIKRNIKFFDDVIKGKNDVIVINPTKDFNAPPGMVLCSGSVSIPDFVKRETINHPDHYGGADNPYEAIKVIESWGLNFNTGNALKYISRAGKKSVASEIEDLKKAAWYLNREIENLQK